MRVSIGGNKRKRASIKLTNSNGCNAQILINRTCGCSSYPLRWQWSRSSWRNSNRRNVGTQKDQLHTMGRIFLRTFPEGKTPLIRCLICKAHIADPDHLISRDFQGTLGPAYLIENVINYTAGPREERLLITGLHIVCDVSCVGCQNVLGK